MQASSHQAFSLTQQHMSVSYTHLIDQKIISMYAKGMATRQISETIEDIYGFETSEGFISDVTDKICLLYTSYWTASPADN